MRPACKVHSRLDTAFSQRKCNGYIVTSVTHDDKDDIHFRYLEFPSFQKFRESPTMDKRLGYVKPSLEFFFKTSKKYTAANRYLSSRQ